MPETGTIAPAFTLTADDGTEANLSDFRGQKVVLSQGQAGEDGRPGAQTDSVVRI